MTKTIKRTIHFSCGHTENVAITGKDESECERRAQYFEEHGRCSKCYHEEKVQETLETCTEMTVPYHDYIKKYSKCQIKKDSYDKNAKTVVIYVVDPRKKEEYDARKKAEQGDTGTSSTSYPASDKQKKYIDKLTDEAMGILNESDTGIENTGSCIDAMLKIILYMKSNGRVSSEMAGKLITGLREFTETRNMPDSLFDTVNEMFGNSSQNESEL